MPRTPWPQRRVAFALTLLLLAPWLPLAEAEPNPIRAAIASPVEGRTYPRGVAIAFVPNVTTTDDCPIVSWLWRFDDGTTADTREAAHVYRETRTYEPSLHVVGSCGRRHGASLTIDVVNAPPAAALALDASPRAGEPFTLSANGSRDPDGAIAAYRLRLDADALPEQAAPTWNLTLLAAGAHEAELVVVDDEGAVSEPTILAFDVRPGPLARIAVSGPSRVEAGAWATYDLDGFDAHANRVALQQETLSHRAPTLAGPDTVAYSEEGITGTLAIEVTPGPLANITLDGPAEIVAATNATFRLRGADAYGNAAPLAQETLAFTAPTRAGVARACYAEKGVEGCANVTVLPDALDAIHVQGPTRVVAGTSATYALQGLDRYGNAVPLSRDALAWTAPTRAGPALVAHEEQGVRGALDVEVVAGELARIALDGPSRVVAGTRADYTPVGSDAHGNHVPLQTPVVAFDAPTQAGPALVAHEEQGVRGARDVEVVADALNTLLLDGPARVEAGTRAVFALRGEDQYGNAVALQNETLAWDAPLAAGPALACHEEQGVSGCASVEVVAGPLAAILLEGPDALRAGERAEYALHGRDAHGNPVPLQVATLRYDAPTRAGPGEVSYEEQGVRGALAIRILPGPLARLLLEGPARLAVGASATYAISGHDAYGNEVALATKELRVEAPTRPGRLEVAHAEQDVATSLWVDVVAGPLAALRLEGPASVVVGTTAHYDVLGEDAYGNPVETLAQSVALDAPTRAGETTVRHAEGGVEATKRIALLPDALATIEVEGPSEVPAKATIRLLAHGADRYGNAVTLQSASFEWTAPAARGPASACITEQDVTGCAEILVVPRVAEVRVTVSAPRTNLFRDVAVAAAAFDDAGAIMENVPFSWTTSLGTLTNGTFRSGATGLARLTASAQAVQGAASIQVRADLAVEAQAEERSVLHRAAVDGMKGNLSARYHDGGPVADGLATLVITRLGPGAEAWPPERKSLRTDADGRAEFQAALPSGLPGDYRVDVTVWRAGNTGAVTFAYHVAMS